MKIQAGKTLTSDPKKSLRFFLELKPEEGFDFTASIPFDLPELESLVNKILGKMEKRYSVSIEKLPDSDVYQAKCYSKKV